MGLSTGSAFISFSLNPCIPRSTKCCKQGQPYLMRFSLPLAKNNLLIDGLLILLYCLSQYCQDRTSLTLMLLVANLANTKYLKSDLIPGTWVYTSESTQLDLSKGDQHAKV